MWCRVQKSKGLFQNLYLVWTKEMREQHEESQEASGSPERPLSRYLKVLACVYLKHAILRRYTAFERSLWD